MSNHKPPGKQTGPVGCGTHDVVCAVLMPHAPVLVPAVGGVRGAAAEASCQAMRTAAAEVLRQKPDSLLLISPHSPRRSGAYGLWIDDRLEGSFEPFGAAEERICLPCDRGFVNELTRAARARGIVVWEIRDRRLDHGALVPFWFLVEAGWTGPTVVLSLTLPEGDRLTTLGEAIAVAAGARPRRLAIIASGDMSHWLTTGAPCGYHPRAAQFDELFVELVSAGRYREIQNLDPTLRELAAEDAVDSTLLAAAAAGWRSTGHQVLHYESPFGVGYGVAILFAANPDAFRIEPISSCTSECDGSVLPGVARQSVTAALLGRAEAAPAASGQYLQTPRGVFVTVRGRNRKLRGCVGTILPVCADLMAETWRNARLSAFEDARCPPVGLDELGDLRFQVSVLHSFETISSADELDPGCQGVIVSTTEGRRGLLLPGIADIRTGAQQVQLARQKGWIDPQEPVTLQRFRVDRFAEPGFDEKG